MMKSAKWVVCGVTDHQYQVYDGRYNCQVDLQTSTCQCRKWQLSGLPCGHVIAVTRVAGKIQLFVSHHQIDLSTVLIPNDGSLEEAFAAHYKLQIYIDHLGVDFIIAKYIFPNASLAEMMKHVITNYTSDSEENKREVTQNDYTLNQMVEWAEQEHFEDEETKLSCPKINLSTVLKSNKGSSDKSFQSLSYLHEMQKRKQKFEETKAVQHQDIKKHMY
ncbi:oligopeptide transporter [Tanacetum coccineum]